MAVALDMAEPVAENDCEQEGDGELDSVDVGLADIDADTAGLSVGVALRIDVALTLCVAVRLADTVDVMLDVEVLEGVPVLVTELDGDGVDEGVAGLDGVPEIDALWVTVGVFVADCEAL